LGFVGAKVYVRPVQTSLYLYYVLATRTMGNEGFAECVSMMQRVASGECGGREQLFNKSGQMMPDGV
jgi:hypothetical protein